MEPTLLDTLVACEKRVWDALVSGDGAADKAELAPDFLGVYPSGFSDRTGHVAELKDGPTMAAYELSETQIMPLGPDRALLAYLARYQKEGSMAWDSMYISSIWERRDGVWLNIFSQDTPVG